MASVTVVDGIKYGFGLMGYLLVVGIIGGIVAMIGVLMAQGDGNGAKLLGGLVAIVGVLTIYAGGMGIVYKVIADGVEIGVANADR